MAPTKVVAPPPLPSKVEAFEWKQKAPEPAARPVPPPVREDQSEVDGESEELPASSGIAIFLRVLLLCAVAVGLVALIVRVLR